VILHDDTFISLASLYENQAKILEVKISSDSKLIGKPICELAPSLPKNFLIAMVKNQHDIIIPKGSSVLASGDTAIVICGPESAQRVREIF
jgi:trk system potassium uptake protein TrkA